MIPTAGRLPNPNPDPDPDPDPGQDPDSDDVRFTTNENSAAPRDTASLSA